MTTRRTYRVDELAAHVSGEVIGDGAVEISGLETLELSRAGDLTFVGDESYARKWPEAGASAAIVSEEIHHCIDASDGRPLILVADADLAIGSILNLFLPDEEPVAVGCHPGALVDPSARVDSSASVAGGVTIGPGAGIGARTRVDPGVHIGPASTIGDDCHLHSGVVIERGVIIGSRVILHANVVAGSDGFGYRPDPAGKLAKIPHIGTVEIGDDVEIGAGSAVDRAKFGRTIIGEGTKIDNFCQIAHNVRIGRHCVLAAHVAIAGSTVIGDWCQIGGQVGISDHIRIGDRVQIAAQAGVFRDIESDSVVAGAPTMPIREFWRLQSALRKLPAILRSAKGRNP